MATYEPKQRRQVAKQLARIIEQGGKFLCDDILLFLTEESEENIIDAITNYGHTNTRRTITEAIPKPCFEKEDYTIDTAEEAIAVLSKINL